MYEYRYLRNVTPWRLQDTLDEYTKAGWHVHTLVGGGPDVSVLLERLCD